MVATRGFRTSNCTEVGKRRGGSRTDPRRRFGSGMILRAKMRNGMSLLEVVLALAILAMSAGILASVTATAVNNGMMGHRLATAQILAESKMAEVVTGAISIQSATGWTQITDPVPEGIWYYQVQTMDSGNQDMVGVRLSITDEIGLEEQKELFHVARWMINPSLGLDTPPSSAQGTGTPNAAAGGSSAGSGSGAPSAGGIQ